MGKIFNKWKICIFIFLFISSINPASSQTAEEWVDKGTDYFEQGEYNKAIEAFDRSIIINPNDKEVWFIKGSAFAGLGEYDKALEACDRALAIDPNYKEAWYGKAVAFLFSDQYKEVIEAADRALVIDPNYSEALSTKGYGLAGLGEYDKAIEAYNKALAIDPNDEGALYGKSVAFFELGEDEKAVDVYNKALAIDEADSIESNNWIIIGGAIIFILIGLVALRKKIDNKSKDDVFKNTNVDSKINKWKIVGYVFLTWLILIFLAGLIVIFFNGGIYDKYYVIDTNAILWALFSLILSIILSYKLKKISEFIYGIIVFITVFIPIIGIPIALAYSGRGYYELEKKAYKNNIKIVTTLNEETGNKWKMFCQKCGVELKEDSNFCSSCGVTLQDKIATEDEKRKGVQGTGQKPEVNNWKILAYVIFTWLGIAIIAKILVVSYSENPADDLFTVTRGLYGFTSLFLGIIMTYKLKKKIEFVYGFALFFCAPILIDVFDFIGILIMLMCFAKSYADLEKQKLIKIGKTPMG